MSKTTWIERFDHWKANGVLDRLQKLADDETTVYVRRSSGEVQAGRITGMSAGAVLVVVGWVNDQGKAFHKNMRTEQFIAQNLGHFEDCENPTAVNL